MPSSTSSPSSSPPSSEEKHTSAEEEEEEVEDVTPKASPEANVVVAKGDTEEEDDENDKTLTMPSTSQGYQADTSPAQGQSAPSSQEATGPSTARRETTPADGEQEYYYFTTDMANQAVLDIEKEKEKFDSLISWYKHHKEDIPNLGTCSASTSAAPSYVSEKGSTTPMSSQPSSHQSGTSNGALSGHNGFNYSPFAFENNPSSNDPLQCVSSPVNLDDICPSLTSFVGQSSSAPGPSSNPSSAAPATDPMTPTQPQAAPAPPPQYQQLGGPYPLASPNHMMMHHPGGPFPYPHPQSYPQQSPLHPLSFNQQMPTTSASNPPSNGGLKRKATSDNIAGEGPSKQPKIDDLAEPSSGASENDPMRKLEMMANSQNFRMGNGINDVVESNKKDERALKMEKLEGIEKSVEEEMAQQAREAHMKKMQMAAAAAGAPQPYPSPGQYPGPIPGMPPFPGMPPHPGMPPYPGMPGASALSAGAPFPPYPMYPGMTPGSYPMSAPGKMPFTSPSFPTPPGAPSPAAMAAMQQHQAAMHQQAAMQQQAKPSGPQPLNPSMMTPQQQQHHFFHMQQMAHFDAQRGVAKAAAAAGISPNLAARASPAAAPPFPHLPPPNHPMFQQHYQHMMMMRQMHMQAAAAAAQGKAPGAPGAIPGIPGMPMPPGMHPGMMHPGMMPPGMPGAMPGAMPGQLSGPIPGMPPGMQMPPGMMHPGVMPPGAMPGMLGMPPTTSAGAAPQPPAPQQNAMLMVAGNQRPSTGDSTTSNGSTPGMNPHQMGASPWTLTPHYPPPLPMMSHHQTPTFPMGGPSPAPGAP